MDIVIIDNFYENPQAIRQLALQTEYINVTKLNYPGFQSTKTFTSSAVIKKFESILQKNLQVDPATLTFGKFRIMLKETASELKVHVDGWSDWTGVLYLNPDENCHGGTAFYRHKKTGLEGPPTQDQLTRFGFKTWTELETSIIDPDTLNPQAWIRTDYVAMKFNRLVLFRGNKLFHCHTESFGTNLENGRMTQNFFFNENPDA